MTPSQNTLRSLPEEPTEHGGHDGNASPARQQQLSPSIRSLEAVLADLDSMHASVRSKIVSVKTSLDELPNLAQSEIYALQTKNEEMERLLQAEMNAKDKLIKELQAQTEQLGRLQEKVVDQGRVVSELCGEVDRLSKDNQMLREIHQPPPMPIPLPLRMSPQTPMMTVGCRPPNHSPDRPHNLKPAGARPMNMSGVAGNSEEMTMGGGLPFPRRIVPRRMSTGTATCA